MKKSVGIIIGGRTVEHEVSIITGLQVLDNIDKTLYEPRIIYIQKDGSWYVGNSLHNINNYKVKKFDDAYEILPGFKNNKLVLYPHPDIRQGLFGKKYSTYEIDIVFPAVHGTNVEDGALHGLFQMNDVPCAFGSVLSSAVGMDKVIMKKVFESNNLPVVDYTWFYRSSFEEDKENILTECEKIGYPMIVKPANLGSSVGISKAKNYDELLFSIQVAMSYDRKVIVEKCVENVREINCAVMGFENDLTASLCEEPVGWEEFLTYEDKYVNKKKDASESKRRIPADIEKEVEEDIKKYAKEAFRSIDCCGDARIDFLYDGNNIYVNEINTIPGSIAFYLWEGIGISFTELVSRILKFAEIQHEQRKSNIISYDIDLLNKMGSSGKHK
ncbi:MULTISPECIES: D-alanine--D-alanine ligase family protein [unclassified Sedimentibacter]|uniref:D-alanine--D-alanine ligase family protein n=1 Tax=unclassified Sedimentibacter TaxID=2649220 RepID=UPI0027E1A605|nr:D-alanine--D-alanine ligase family protein [Sedimentibacter sp. MB35-C1]WMJ76363.1 D-alanine--D-alanine ligase family protein [Sedimentibacter sp. MB35-C1]